ncbi:MAG: pentapeptide repeat-containing protein, partial [Verrucomicrobiales bacterium]
MTGIVAGTGHNAALKEDGNIVTWGSNDYGQGDPMPGISPANLRGADLTGANLRDSELTGVDFGNGTVISLSIGDYHTLALKE